MPSDIISLQIYCSRLPSSFCKS